MPKLEELINKGEGDTLEFKESLKEEKEILETICAFLNSKGGTILVGVDDRGKIKGIELGKGTVEDLLNRIKFKIEPSVIPQIEAISVDGRYVLRITVQEGLDKPYLFNGIAYRRVGRSNHRVSREELERMVLEKWKGLTLFEDRALDFGLEEVDENEIRSFVDLVKESRRLEMDYRDKEDFLKRLGLMKDGRPTSTAALFFFRNPQVAFPYAVIKCGLFRDGAVVVEREASGSLIAEVRSALSFLLENIPHTWKIDVESGVRKEEYEVPPEALREALVNAVIHRDYEIRSPIYVRIFQDRIEVTNPGSLLPPLTPEGLKKEHPSVLRNPRIANLFFLAGFVEKWGYGTNKIISLCTSRGLKEPEFISNRGFFTVVIFREGMNEMERMIYELVKEGMGTSRSIAEKLGINERTARKYLSSLLSKKLVLRKRVGRKIVYVPP